MTHTTALAAGSAATARPPAAPAGDVPDILFVLRRYRWLLVIGTLLGTLIGVSAWFTIRRVAPEYTVSAHFKVLPPPQGIENVGLLVPTMTSEEITRLVRDQEVFIKEGPVLEKALRSEAFRDPRVEWYRDLPRLKRKLIVAQVPNSDVFQVSLVGAYPQELAKVVDAIASTYYDELRDDTTVIENRRVKDLREAEQKLSDSVKKLAAVIEEFRSASDLSTMTGAYNAKVATLGQLNVEIIKAELELTSAKSYLDDTKKKVESNTLQLPAELERFVEEDPSLRYLEQTKLALEQERAAAIDKYGKLHAIVKALDARIEENNKQASDARERLRGQARLLVQEKADSAVKSAQARAEELGGRRNRLETELKDLDRKLVEYRTKSQQLETEQKLLDDVKRKVALETVKGGIENTRVRKLFATVTPPDPSEISFPLFKHFLPGGLLGGLLVSFGFAYLLELTNTRVRTPRDITRTMQMPLLGFVPHQEDDRFVDGNLATSIRTAPGSMIAESFRLIRGRLAAMVDGKPVHTLLVASISPGGGATTVANNLANGIALNGQRVLLVDANFHRPGLRSHYQNLPAVGLGDVLANPGTLDEAIVTSEVPSLDVLGAGSKTATNASELLGSKAFGQLLQTLKSRYDVVIFDGAPLNLVSDSVLVASKVDGVVAVVRAGMVSRGMVTRVRDQLKQVRANLMGLVLNAAQTQGSGYFKENYRTFYRYSAKSQVPAGTAR